MYDPIRDDYNEWEEDFARVSEWIDGTHIDQIVLHFGYHYQWMNKERKLHRDEDKPVDIRCDSLAWYKEGHLFRIDDKPCYIENSGFRYWVSGSTKRLHRDNDRPAWIDQDGYKRWYKDNVEYFPISSIMKSLEVSHSEMLVSSYLKNMSEIPCYLQEFVCSLSPSYVNLIPSKFISDKIVSDYYGHYSLGEISL